MVVNETTYKGFLIGRVSHPSLISYYELYGKQGNHIETFSDLKDLKKQIDNLINKDLYPEKSNLNTRIISTG